MRCGNCGHQVCWCPPEGTEAKLEQAEADLAAARAEIERWKVLNRDHQEAALEAEHDLAALREQSAAAVRDAFLHGWEHSSSLHNYYASDKALAVLDAYRAARASNVTDKRRKPKEPK